MEFWINAGEMSGDLHGGKLMEALTQRNAHIRFAGMGGPAMREQGLDSLLRVEELSVMGITEVLGHLPRILGMLRRIKALLATRRPDAVILIDAPEFNFRVAKYAHELGIPVYYYISPKLWAWRTGRAKFIAKYVTRMISILPFETDFYARFGMTVDYVGNPLVDMVDWPAIDHLTPISGRIGLLPGSRRREIEPLMPEFAKAATLLSRALPHLSFHCVQAPGVDPQRLRELWQTDVPLVIHGPEDRYAFMRQCEMLIAASGTVTLESALIGTPTLVAYRLSRLSYAIGRRVVQVPYVALPNLIMGREVFPELLQEKATGAVLAEYALRWLAHPAAMQAVRCELTRLRQMLGKPGAADRAAAVILDDIASRDPRKPV